MRSRTYGAEQRIAEWNNAEMRRAEHTAKTSKVGRSYFLSKPIKG